MLNRRRTDRTLEAVDGLLDASIQRNDLGGRRLANLAAALAIENSGADWGCLLLDQGAELTPVLCLRSDLKPEAREITRDRPVVVERSLESLVTESEGGDIAAPVLLRGKITGMLYLTGVPRHGRDLAVRLTSAVALRIAALLANAELVENLARSTRDLEILDSLSLSLSAETLETAHLDLALERSVRATSSDDGLLGVLDEGGDLLDVRVCGSDPEHLSLTARGLVAGNFEPEIVLELLGPLHLLEPLLSDTFTPRADLERAGRIGFLAVRRCGDSLYGQTDRTFFRALAHLLAGALARHHYFQQAAQDPLTDTGSRLALSLSLAEAESRTRANGFPFSVTLIDIDHFKQVNDRYGHAAGDQVLRRIGSLLRKRLRAHDSVARYGGDEFVIILPDTPASEAAKLADELRLLVRNADFPEIEGSVSISAGVAACRSTVPNVDRLMRRADRALYRSKADGRDRVTVDD